MRQPHHSSAAPSGVGRQALAALAALVALAAPGAARAASTDLDALLADVTCATPGAPVDAADARARLVAAAGLPLTRDVARALSDDALGRLAAEAPTGPLAALLARATALVDPLAPASIASAGPARFTLAAAETGRPARAIAIDWLNGRDDLVSIACTAASAAPPSPPPPAAAPPRRPRTLIVADGRADIIRPQRDRAFATIGYVADAAADTRTINASFVLARQPRPIWSERSGAEIAWTPFLQYNRRVGRNPRDEVNDLTAGASFVARNPRLWGGARGVASAAFQTDDEGRSRVLAGDALVDFQRLPDCDRHERAGWDLRCSTSFVMDFADVDDPGDSVRLATVDGWWRTGVDVTAIAERRFALGLVRLNASWSGRTDLWSGEASGALFTVGASLRDTAASNLSLETRWSKGKTLNTLTDVDVLSVRLGYRM